jgi:hypothetical protein
MRTGVDISKSGAKSAAFSKLLHGQENGIKVKAQTFVEKYVTKRSQYKSFAEKVKAEKSGDVGKSI